MKQLSIYCSRDLEERVIHALDHAGIEMFLRVPGIGERFLDAGQLPRTMRWDAALFLVPGAEADRIDRVIGELEQFTGSCEIEPCLRLVVESGERFI